MTRSPTFWAHSTPNSRRVKKCRVRSAAAARKGPKGFDVDRMTIIVFLIDTSSSMNQRVFLGGRPSLLDVAKSAVETFVKVRQRSIDSRQDRYMLLTFEEPPANIKAGWKENLATFMAELKNLQATGLTTLGNALRHTFDVLNVNRMQHGIDTYGQGKCPFYLEPSIIVCITDGGQMSSNSGVHDEVVMLKMHGSSPGSELTREPFRWDQRLFSLVLRMTGQPSGDRETGLVPSDNSPIDAMCEVTGGRSYAITTQRMLHQCIDSLVQKVQAGVVIHFEKYGPDPPPSIVDGVRTGEDDIELLVDDNRNGNGNNNNNNKFAWHSVRRMIYVPRTNQKGFAGGFWPIPESYWPDPSIPSLLPRTAHPNIKILCQGSEPLVVENFPFDKYELEPSPLTQFIIGRKQPAVCWQVYMPGSLRNNQLGQPFGYLKASTNLTCVNLFVMPYNYPVVLPLIDELFRIHRLKPTSEWKAHFAIYLSSMPPYYAGPLKRALMRMGAGNIAPTIPEENYLSYSVLNYLKKLKAQAKTEYDRTCNDVALRVLKSAEVMSSSVSSKRVITSFKNPFDIPRHQLLDQLARLRTLFLRPSRTSTSAIQHESLHNMPVGQMGNYQEYLKRMPNPLRELESAPVRQHMFGNPFKIDKKLMMIDEAVDIDLLGGGGSGVGGKMTKKENAAAAAAAAATAAANALLPVIPPFLRPGQKRKAGPLPKDFKFTPYKFRRTHKGMMASSLGYNNEGVVDNSDNDSLYGDGCAPLSPSPSLYSLTPPSSPSPMMTDASSYYPMIMDKENSSSPSSSSSVNHLHSLDSFTKDLKVFTSSSNNLIIDETPPLTPPPTAVPVPVVVAPAVVPLLRPKEEPGVVVAKPKPMPKAPSEPVVVLKAVKKDPDMIKNNDDVKKDKDAPSISHDRPNNKKHEMNGKTKLLLPVKNDNVKVPVTSSSSSSSKAHVPPPPPASSTNSSLGHGQDKEKIKKPKPPTTTPTATVLTPVVVLPKIKVENQAPAPVLPLPPQQQKAKVVLKPKPQPQQQQAIVEEVETDRTRRKNLELRVDLHKEIRRPILRLDYILSQLSNITGPFTTKQHFIKSLAREALRFKRKRLAKELEQQAEILASCYRTPAAS